MQRAGAAPVDSLDPDDVAIPEKGEVPNGDPRARILVGHAQSVEAIAVDPEDGRLSRREGRRQRKALHLAHATSDRAARVATVVLTVLALVGITIWVIWQIRPDLIFGPAMDVGGDNGGHVAAPYFLIHQSFRTGGSRAGTRNGSTASRSTSSTSRCRLF